MAAPTVVLCVGMAGSGKTTFMQRMAADLAARGAAPFVVNLDPAVRDVPFPTNIDVRDTVKYKEVMRTYGLGPNGAIVTALNLFTTKFDEVLSALPRESSEHTHVLVDTPGQIEIFTWSASGSIITEALATQHPTVIAYVVDTPRCARPATFVSNMLYACSILYKTRLPLVVVFNKTDVADAETVRAWMADSFAFERAVAEDPASLGAAAGLPGDEYMAPLVQAMAGALEEFYGALRTAAVSAYTGEGMREFWAAVDAAADEYAREYVPEMERRAEDARRARAAAEDAEVVRLMADLRADDSADADDASD